MRSKKSLKQDRAKIALKQKHERRYLKKISREQLKKLKKQKGMNVWGIDSRDTVPEKEKCSKAQLIRITRGLLKCLEIRK